MPHVLSDRAHLPIRWILALCVLAVPAAAVVSAPPAAAQSSDDAELRARAAELARQRQAVLLRSRELAAERREVGSIDQLGIDRELRELRELLEQILREEAPIRRALAPSEIPDAERVLKEDEGLLEEARERLAANPDDRLAALKVTEAEQLVEFERNDLERLRTEADGDDDTIVDAGLGRYDEAVDRALQRGPDDQDALPAGGLALLPDDASLSPGELEQRKAQDPTVRSGLEPVEDGSTGSRNAPAVQAARDRLGAAERELALAETALADLPAAEDDAAALQRLGEAREEVAAAGEALDEAELDLDYEQLAAGAAVEGREVIVRLAEQAVADSAGPQDFVLAEVELARARAALAEAEAFDAAVRRDAVVVRGGADPGPGKAGAPAERPAANEGGGGVAAAAQEGAEGAGDPEAPPAADPDAAPDGEADAGTATEGPANRTATGPEGDPEIRPAEKVPAPEIRPAEDTPVTGIGGLVPSIGWGARPDPGQEPEPGQKPDPDPEPGKATESRAMTAPPSEPPGGLGGCGPGGATAVLVTCAPEPGDGIVADPVDREPTPSPLECPGGARPVAGPDGPVCPASSGIEITTPPPEPPPARCPDGSPAPDGMLIFCPPVTEPGIDLARAEKRRREAALDAVLNPSLNPPPAPRPLGGGDPFAWEAPAPVEPFLPIVPVGPVLQLAPAPPASGPFDVESDPFDFGSAAGFDPFDIGSGAASTDDDVTSSDAEPPTEEPGKEAAEEAGKVASNMTSPDPPVAAEPDSCVPGVPC